MKVCEVELLITPTKGLVCSLEKLNQQTFPVVFNHTVSTYEKK